VINYLEIALEKPLDDDTKDALKSSYSASQSLAYVIDDLLNLTSSENSKFAMVESAFNIQAAIEEVIDSLKAHAKRKSLLFSNIIEPEGFPSFVKGDLQRFQQVLSQIVSNAIRYTREGSITVETKVVTTDGAFSQVEIRVRDTGEGLSEDELDDLFQDLEQISTDESTGGGTQNSSLMLKATQSLQSLSSRPRLGLGLALVARFIILRDGQLRMKSTKNEGTTVTLSIPWMACPEPPHPFQTVTPHPTTFAQPEVSNQSQLQQGFPSTSAPRNPPGMPNFITPILDLRSQQVQNPTANTSLQRGSLASIMSPYSGHPPMVVAIADDNTINLQVLKKRLEILRHTVFMSRDGQECFEVFEKSSVDINFILMDLDVSFPF
jgi:CheY-like chemotaxis protein